VARRTESCRRVAFIHHHIEEQTMKRYSGVAAVLLASSLFLASCEFRISTANIADAKMARGIDEEGKAVDQTNSFEAGVKEVFAVVDLDNAPEGTDLLAIWRNGEGKEIIRKAIVAGGDKDMAHFSVSHDQGLPPGKYSCEIYINRLASDTTVAPDQTLNFSVQ
jgi:hypothetical protein